MSGNKSKKPQKPAHMRPDWGGSRENSGRPPGTKKQIPGQMKLSFVSTTTTARQSTTAAGSPPATDENNENNGPAANNGQAERRVLAASQPSMPVPPKTLVDLNEELAEEISRSQEGEDEDGDEDIESDGSPPKKDPKSRAYTQTFHYEYLQSTLSEVKQQINSGSKRPLCYMDRSFWIPAFNPTLTDGAEKQPRTWCLPDVFVWLPRYMKPLPKLHCPHCSSTHEEIKGYPHPRRVVGLDTCYYLLTSQHKCLSCRKSYLATNRSVVEKMPEYLQLEFPCFLTHRNALDKKVLDLMRACFAGGMCASSFSKMIRELHCKRYHERMLSYLSLFQATQERIFKTNLEDFPKFSQNYGGYVPSARWFGDVFVNHSQLLRPSMDKDMMKVEATIIQLDHSFKVPALLAQVQGKSVFPALLTVVNEYGQIKAQNFAFSKSHDEMRDMLAAMRRGLEAMGLGPIRLAYTDHVTADKSFLESIFPSLKQDIISRKKSSGFRSLTLPELITKQVVVTDSMAITVMQSILNECEDEDEEVLNVGLDGEWEVSQQEGPGTLATLQLAWGQRVVLFWFSKFPSPMKSHLKILLEQFLQSPKIRKIGRNVGGDIAKLIRDYRLDAGTSNVLELGAFARSRGVVKDGRASLSEIVENTLRKTLPKDQNVRISNWESGEDRETRDKENRDLTDEQVTYALLDAYASLKAYEAIVALPDINAPLTLSDCKVGAQVNYCPGGRPVLLGTVVAVTTKKRVRLRVDKVLMPAYSRKPEDYISVLPKTLKINAVQWHETEENDFFGEEEDISPEVACFVDKTTVYSRVLQDPFHLLGRIDVDLSHGCCKAFMRDFSEALFQDNPEDVALMKRHCVYRGWDFDTVRSDRRDFYFKSVRRIIADPVSLHKRVEAVFEIYKNTKDAKTGVPLFSAKAHDQSKSILDLIDEGLVSDPPDIPLYFLQDEDKITGLRTYWCVRGTNFVEGGVHQKIIRNFGPINASPMLADALLAEYRHRHNIDMGVLRKGSRNAGHYNTWIIDRLKKVTSALMKESAPLNDYLASYEFQATEERYGIVPVSKPDVFSPFDVHLKLSPSLKYLSRRLGTKYPILPVHTDKEKGLFHKVFKENPNFDMSTVIKKFAEKADGVNVFYKLECHIRDYKKIYEKSANSADSLRTIRSNRTALSQQRETERVVETIGNQSLLTVVGPVDQRHVAEQASPEPGEELASLTDGDAFQADGDQQDSVLQDVPMATDSVSQEQEIPDSSVPQDVSDPADLGPHSATVATADSISPMPFVQSHPGTQAHLQFPSVSFLPQQMFVPPQFAYPQFAYPQFAYPPQMFAPPQFILPNLAPLPSLGQRSQFCTVCGGTGCGLAVVAAGSSKKAAKRCSNCGHTGCKGRGSQPCQFANAPDDHVPTSRRKKSRAK